MRILLSLLLSSFLALTAHANDADYFGFRASIAHEFSDDWSLNASYGHQELDADGVFFVDPNLGDLEVQRFADETLEAIEFHIREIILHFFAMLTSFVQ